MPIDANFISVRKIKLNEPLAKHTTFRIGGSARVWVKTDTLNDLKVVLKFIQSNNLKFLVIGSGSNLLVGDSGFEGVVISLGDDFKEIKHNKNKIFSGAGASLTNLINYACSLGLSGLEVLAGIPGQVGGSLFVNAGTQDGSIGNFVEEVFCLDRNANVIRLSKKDLKFKYRSSNLSDYIVLGAWFSLKKKSSRSIKKVIREMLEMRRKTQDTQANSAGCIFKNPRNNSAGKLIDECGLKGKSIGDAYISSKHANFIINKGQARASDVLRLIDLIKREVKNKFKICLEQEIKILS